LQGVVVDFWIRSYSFRDFPGLESENEGKNQPGCRKTMVHNELCVETPRQKLLLGRKKSARKFGMVRLQSARKFAQEGDALERSYSSLKCCGEGAGIYESFSP